MVEALVLNTNIMFIVAVSVIVGCFAYAMFELRTARAKIIHLERNNRRMVSDAYSDGFNAGVDAMSGKSGVNGDLG